MKHLFYFKLVSYFLLLIQVGGKSGISFDLLYLFLKSEIENKYHASLLDNQNLTTHYCVPNSILDVYIYCCREYVEVDLDEFGVRDSIISFDSLDRLSDMPGGWFYNSSHVAFVSKIVHGLKNDYLVVELLSNNYLCTGGSLSNLYHTTTMQKLGVKYLFVFDTNGSLSALYRKKVFSCF